MTEDRKRKRTYLAMYDLPVTKPGLRRRRKLHKLLEGYGIRRQYSVFEVVLRDRDERETLLKKVRTILDEESDKFALYRVKSGPGSALFIGEGALLTVQQTYVV
jgi:CRISPR-associated protein Cas2